MNVSTYTRRNEENIQHEGVCPTSLFYKWGGYIYTNKRIVNTVKQKIKNIMGDFCACK